MLLEPAAALAGEPSGLAQTTLQDIGHLAPMMIVALWALVQLLADAFAGPGMRLFQRRLALVGVGLAAAAALSQFGTVDYDDGVPVFSSFLVVDQFSLLFDLAILGVVGAVIVFAGDYARSHRFEYGEQEALLLIAAFGMMILAHAADLLALFLGIETMSIAVYVLVGARWNQRQSAEAALKYFLMGAFSSGVLLMGIALIYGATGETGLVEVGHGVKRAFTEWGAVQPHVAALEEAVAPPSLLGQYSARAALGIAPAALAIPGILLTLAAVLFKISAAPLHMWTPDAYEGAPSPVTAFMGAGVKLGAFAALLKLFVAIFFAKRLVSSGYAWTSVVAVVALLSMFVGNLAAVRQSNVKRLLAYSSIAHVGYLLVGVVAAASFYGSGVVAGSLKAVDQIEWARSTGDLAVAGIIFYLVTYAVATIGAFACVSFLGEHKREATSAHEWSGLAQRHPGMALAMTVCLLSLMGMPPMAGFFGKLFVFKAGLEHTSTWLHVLVVLALLNSVIGAYYYLRLIVSMYFRPAPEEPVGVLDGKGVRIVAGAAAIGSLALGIGADPFMRRCELAASGFVYPAGVGSKGEWVDRLRARWEAEADAAAAAEAEAADAAAAPPIDDVKADDAKPADANAEGDAKAEPDAKAPDGEAKAVPEMRAPSLRPRPEGDAKALPVRPRPDGDAKAPPARPRPTPDAKAEPPSP